MSRSTPQNTVRTSIASLQTPLAVDVVQAEGRRATETLIRVIKHDVGRIQTASVQDFADAVDSIKFTCSRDVLDTTKRLEAYRRALLDPSTGEIEGFARWVEKLQHLKEESRRAESPPLPPRAAIETDDPAGHFFGETTPVVPEYKLRQAEPPPPPLEPLRHLLQTSLPVLYSRVLEPTLADIREEHAVALAEGGSLKARCVLLRGLSALAAAAVSQLGFSLLGGIAALWRARSSK